MPPTAVVSVAGRRGHNEDVGGIRSAHVAGRPVSLLLVADGMGGHAHGEVASRLAADALLGRWDALLADLARVLTPEASGDAAVPPEAEDIARAYLRDSYADAEAAISARGQGSGMGTTLVSAVILGDRAILGNVGDSRAYLVRDGHAEQLTDDHSVVADAVRQGALTPEEAEASPFQHALTRALDGQGDRGPDLFPSDGWLALGDAAAVLLCSDGLSGTVEPPEMAEALARTADVDEAARTLAASAFEGGSPDNITLAILEHGTLRRSGFAPLASEHIETVLAEARTDEASGAASETHSPEAMAPDLRPRESLGRTPWVLAALAAVLLALALWAWLGSRSDSPESRQATVRGPAFPVPSAFLLEHEGDHLRWQISGIATRDDTVRVTVSLPADTLTRTVTTVGDELPLAEIAALWPSGTLPRGDYVWRVEARSLSGSRLRSGPEPLILDRGVSAFDSLPAAASPEARPDRP